MTPCFPKSAGVLGSKEANGRIRRPSSLPAQPLSTTPRTRGLGHNMEVRGNLPPSAPQALLRNGTVPKPYLN
jgi:hypothetical protein